LWRVAVIRATRRHRRFFLAGADGDAEFESTASTARQLRWTSL